MQTQRSRGSDDEDQYSADAKSPMPQHPDRPSSVSPANGMNGVPQLQRQASDYYMNAMNGGMAVPPHMRGEITTPRSSSPAQHGQYPMPTNGHQSHRPSLTSNPSSGGYNPPQILEPPTANGQQQNGSGNNSPHIGASMGGWQSPHNGLGANQTTDYAYPDPNGQYNVNTQMYYQPQRPHSTGPIEYQTPMNGREMWAQHPQ